MTPPLQGAGVGARHPRASGRRCSRACVSVPDQRCSACGARPGCAARALHGCSRLPRRRGGDRVCLSGGSHGGSGSHTGSSCRKCNGCAIRTPITERESARGVARVRPSHACASECVVPRPFRPGDMSHAVNIYRTTRSMHGDLGHMNGELHPINSKLFRVERQKGAKST